MKKLETYVVWSVESLKKIQRYTQGVSFESFISNDEKVDACLMQFVHLGETLKKVEKYYESLPGIPVKEIAGMRDMIAHDYFGIDRQIVWETIEDDVPELLELLKKMI